MRKLTLIIFLGALTFTSCMKSTTNKRKSTSSGTSTYNGDQYDYTNSGSGTNTNDSITGDDDGTNGVGNVVNDPGEGYGDGNEDGLADAGQTQDYITISNLVVHSKLHSSNMNRSYLWSSQAQLGSGDQGMFYTNSRFNLRVRAQAAPPKGNDSAGVYCSYQQYQDFYRYTKLDLDVCVRTQTGSCIQTHTFSEVPVGEVSKVKEFSVPATSEPLVVEVVDARWDTGCRYDRDRSDRFCPTYAIWSEHCVKFDIQFSTDYTKDFAPTAPRY